MVDSMLQECAKMQRFRHPNVMPLIGVCLDGGPTPLIVMPYMVNGSLLDYLRKERASLVHTPARDSDAEERVGIQKYMNLWFSAIFGSFPRPCVLPSALKIYNIHYYYTCFIL